MTALVTSGMYNAKLGSKANRQRNYGFSCKQMMVERFCVAKGVVFLVRRLVMFTVVRYDIFTVQHCGCAAERLGIARTIPGFREPRLRPRQLRRGVSFASAGSGYDDATARISVCQQHNLQHFFSIRALSQATLLHSAF
jgi:hypothetical protein